MLWGTCDFLWVVDRPDLQLGELRQRALNSGCTALMAYSTLSHNNLMKQRVNYKVRPKWCLGIKMCMLNLYVLDVW